MKQELTLDWHEVCRLLESRQYNQVSEFLQEAQISCEHTNDAIMRDILIAAHRICLACSRCREEKRWLKRACEKADQGEQELRQGLHDIFDLFDREETPEAWPPQPPSPATPPAEPTSAARDGPELGKASGLLQHLWRLLGARQEFSFSPEQPSLPREEAAPTLPTTLNNVVPVSLSEVQRPDSPLLAVYCLGPFRVYLNDQLITNCSSGKGKAIYKYLVANRRRPVARDILMNLLWPEVDLESARNNLNVAIYMLRQAFRAFQPDFSCILYEDDHYLLNPAVTTWVDVEQFEQYFRAGRNLERQGKLLEAIRAYELAEGLYQGDFLEEDLYEDWPILQRESLKDSYLIILGRLSRYYLEAKQYTTCIHLCQKILTKDDCREDAHRRLMRCYSRQGHLNLALRQYHLCSEALSRELDVSPTPKTVALYNQIRRREAV